MLKRQILILIAVSASLAACPRLAYIDVYNNTPVQLEVNSSGYAGQIQPGGIVRLRLSGQQFSINSDLGHWVYRRRIPHDGEDGEYFDGTLRLQVNANGKIYALSKEATPPASDIREQPEGFPLIPVTTVQEPHDSETET